MWPAILRGSGMNGDTEDPAPAAHDAAPATYRRQALLPPPPVAKLQQVDYAAASGAAAAFATASAICWLGLRSERDLRLQPHHSSEVQWLHSLPWQRVVAAQDEARRMSTLAGSAPHAAATVAAEQAAPRLQPKALYRPGTFPQRVGVVVAAVGLCTVATAAVNVYIKSLPNHEVCAC
jgi:hypothetical protein